MSKTVEMIFDFGSPNAYLAWHALKGVLARTGASLYVTPALLGGIFKATNNRPPFVAFGEVKGKMDYEMLEVRRFIARHDLGAFRMNPHFPINTIAIQRCLLTAQNLGVQDAFIETGLKAMWEDGLDLGSAEVLSGVIAAAGLDAEAIHGESRTDAVKKALIGNTEGAVARGVFGIPTFFVGEEMFFGKERLAQVEELLAA